MSCLIKRGHVYYIQYRIDGKYVQQSLKTRNERIAQDRQREIDSDLCRHRDGIAPMPRSWDDVMAGFMREKLPFVGGAQAVRYRCHFATLKQWLEMAEVRTVGELKAIHVIQFYEWRRGHAAPKTAADDMACLKRIWKWAAANGMVKPDSVKWPDKPKVQAVHPERNEAYLPAEVTAIVEWFRTEKRPEATAVTILAYLGCRYGELAVMRVRDLDLVGRVATINSAKTRTMAANMTRKVPIHEKLVPTLAAAIAGKASVDLVVPELGEHSDSWLREVMALCCRNLGIQYRRVHGLRHSWITGLLRAGVPAADVMYLAGHRNLATTQGYLTVGESSPDAIARLPY